MSVRIGGGLAVACALFVTAPLPANAQYYAGKTITMLINYGAGGNTDIEGRVFQRHLSDHIPGHPNIVVLNKPGAGGLVGINYLGSGAVPADGGMFCFCTLNAVAPIIHDPALKVKVQDFAFIGGVAQWSVGYIRKDVPPGMNKPADIAKATNIFAAGYNPTTTQDMRIKLTLDMIGAKYKMVTGFRSSNDVNHSILQKETNFSTSSMPSFEGQVMPNLVKPGIVIPVWYYETSGPKPGTFRTSPVLTKQHVPTFADVYKQVHGKYPSGPKWEAFVLINDIASAMLRAVMLPHGSPKAAVDDLRKAFAALPQDKGFVSDYEKIIRTQPELVTYQEGEAILSKLNGVNPDTVALLKKVAGTK